MTARNEREEKSLAKMLKEMGSKKRQKNVGKKVDGKDGQPKLPSPLPTAKVTGPGELTDAEARKMEMLRRGGQVPGAESILAKQLKRMKQKPLDPSDPERFAYNPFDPKLFVTGAKSPSTEATASLYSKVESPTPTAVVLSPEERNQIFNINKAEKAGKITAEEADMGRDDIYALIRAKELAKKKPTEITTPTALGPQGKLNQALENYVAGTDKAELSLSGALAHLEASGFLKDEQEVSLSPTDERYKDIIDQVQGILGRESKREPKEARVDIRLLQARIQGIVGRLDPLKDPFNADDVFSAALPFLPSELTMGEINSVWGMVVNFGEAYAASQGQALRNEAAVEKSAQESALAARQNALITGDLDALLQANKSYLAHGGRLDTIENQALRVDILKSFFQNPAYLIHAQIFGLLDELEMVLGMKFSVPDFRGMFKDKVPRSFGEWARLSVDDPMAFNILAQITAAEQGITPEQLFAQMKARLPSEIETPAQTRVIRA